MVIGVVGVSGSRRALCTNRGRYRLTVVVDDGWDVWEGRCEGAKRSEQRALRSVNFGVKYCASSKSSC